MTTILYPIQHDREALQALAEEHRYSAVAMAAAIIMHAVQHYRGVPSARHREPLPQGAAAISRAERADWLERRYVAEGRLLREIAGALQ